MKASSQHRPGPGELDVVHVDADAMTLFGTSLLISAGATSKSAQIVMAHLVEADQMGLRSHGVLRIPQYLVDIASGAIDPAAVPRFDRIAAGRSECDGHNGLGQVVGLAMVREAVSIARETGVAFVVGRHMGHTGRIGAYPAAIAESGMVGIAVCGGPPSGHWVAPFGAVEGRLATNPIAYAFPVNGGPAIVADFSTSAVPEGVVRSLHHRGVPAPEGALRRADGSPTTDPAVLYEDPRGSIQPLGGLFGYRGTALGILVEVLAGLLSGDRADDRARTGSNLALIALSTGGDFAALASGMAAYVRSARPIDPAKPVEMPGDRELRQAGDNLRNAIMVDQPTWTRLLELAAIHRVNVPTCLSES